MDHHVTAVVEQDPAGAGKTLDVQRLDLPITQLVCDEVGDGLDLTLVLTRADQEDIGKVADRRKIERLEIYSLALYRSLDGDARLFFRRQDR